LFKSEIKRRRRICKKFPDIMCFPAYLPPLEI